MQSAKEGTQKVGSPFLIFLTRSMIFPFKEWSQEQHPEG
jgi:hypothetical protein